MQLLFVSIHLYGHHSDYLRNEMRGRQPAEKDPEPRKANGLRQIKLTKRPEIYRVHIFNVFSMRLLLLEMKPQRAV